MKLYDELIIELSIIKAKLFGSSAHIDQYRKTSGKPYFTHPTAVYNILKNIGINDVNILISSLLHDTIEDTDVSFNNIKNSFNIDIANIVKELTSSSKGKLKYGKAEYLLYHMVKMSNTALLIKLADRLHNLDDIDKLDKDKAKSYLLQTKYILDGLATKRNMNTKQLKLIRKINNIINKFSYIWEK